MVLTTLLPADIKVQLTPFAVEAGAHRPAPFSPRNQTTLVPVEDFASVRRAQLEKQANFRAQLDQQLEDKRQHEAQVIADLRSTHDAVMSSVREMNARAHQLHAERTHEKHQAGNDLNRYLRQHQDDTLYAKKAFVWDQGKQHTEAEWPATKPVVLPQRGGDALTAKERKALEIAEEKKALDVARRELQAAELREREALAQRTTEKEEAHRRHEQFVQTWTRFHETQGRVSPTEREAAAATVPAVNLTCKDIARRYNNRRRPF